RCIAFLRHRTPAPSIVRVAGSAGMTYDTFAFRAGVRTAAPPQRQHGCRYAGATLPRRTMMRTSRLAAALLVATLAASGGERAPAAHAAAPSASETRQASQSDARFAELSRRYLDQA